ncbi:hypothetical protein AlacWU_02471 [Aspergillus niger]|uniref:Uncharacterized protein n=2 Tax=Aspergillus niger TaxID=5061 RepID=A2R5V0_ASPNC|nr:hypothetical protein An15g05640 [Aspergillus niger]GJP89572.1 hypothetical protein AlacWU_02471 [Aspergillus niger]CAK42517.1 hypothetical protein An15g05640 [Aspergillus niger]
MENNEESEHYEDSEDSEGSEDSDLSNGQPEENYIYLDDLPTLATCYLYVIIVPGDGELKHWILCIDAPTWTEKPMVHLVGSPTYYRVEARFLTRNDERRIIKRVNLCDIPNAQNVYDDIIDAGEWAEIDNQDPSYNSQIYILELLDDLEHRGIVSMNDPSMASDIERVCLTWDISCYLSRNIKGTLDLFCNFTFLSQRLAVYIASAIGSTPIGTMHK